MRGLVIMFLVLSCFGISWGYLDEPARNAFLKVVRKNLLPIVLALVAVGFAIFLSLNTNIRLI